MGFSNARLRNMVSYPMHGPWRQISLYLGAFISLWQCARMIQWFTVIGKQDQPLFPHRPGHPPIPKRRHRSRSRQRHQRRGRSWRPCDRKHGRRGHASRPATKHSKWSFLKKNISTAFNCPGTARTGWSRSPKAMGSCREEKASTTTLSSIAFSEIFHGFKVAMSILSGRGRVLKCSSLRVFQKGFGTCFGTCFNFISSFLHFTLTSLILFSSAKSLHAQILEQTRCGVAGEEFPWSWFGINHFTVNGQQAQEHVDQLTCIQRGGNGSGSSSKIRGCLHGGGAGIKPFPKPRVVG